MPLPSGGHQIGAVDQRSKLFVTVSAVSNLGVKRDHSGEITGGKRLIQKAETLLHIHIMNFQAENTDFL